MRQIALKSVWVPRERDRPAAFASWFAGLPPAAEPEVRAAVVEALDESPSAAYREYLLRLSRTERDPDVLEAVWHEDPITVALTAETLSLTFDRLFIADTR